MALTTAFAPLTTPLVRVGAQVERWAVESQQRSRRNAMVAATALAQRRAEREDVEDFLAALTRRDERPSGVGAAHA